VAAEQVPQCLAVELPCTVALDEQASTIVPPESCLSVSAKQEPRMIRYTYLCRDGATSRRHRVDTQIIGTIETPIEI
jgi:hypothetical protein